jgi:hypothetical protein
VALALENWDVEFKALKLGGDPQKSLEFIRTEIGWLPYRGVLRGAWGALQSRSGNSLDRSLLLAELVRGKNKVRFARATLGANKREKGQAGTEYMLVVTFVASGAVWAVIEFYPDLVARFACTVAVEACNQMLGD